MTQQVAADGGAGEPAGAGGSAGARARRGVSFRTDVVVAVVLGVAALMTAWSAYQSAKWGTVQSASYGAAGAARTESSRASTLAGQQTIVDVQLFTSWLAALEEEQGDILEPGYVPDPESYSGFLYARFRPEFRPAVHAWLAEEPATNTDAPPSPFAMEEYVQAARTESLELEETADAAASRAQTAAERKDNYVLLTVMCSSVLFLGGIGSKLSSRRARSVLLGLAIGILLATGGVLISFPIQI